MPEPTALPWHVVIDADGSAHVFGAQPDEWVADCGMGGNSEQCADFIVLAANSYRALTPAQAAAEELVGVLEVAYKALTTAQCGDDFDADVQTVFSALKKVRP